MEIFQLIVLWIVIPAVLFIFLIETAVACIRERGGQGFSGVGAGVVLAIFYIVLSPHFNLRELPFLNGWNTLIAYLILFVVGTIFGFFGTLGMRQLFKAHLQGIAGLILTFGFSIALYNYFFFTDIKVISECFTFGTLFGTFFYFLFDPPNWSRLFFTLTWSQLFFILRHFLNRAP